MRWRDIIAGTDAGFHQLLLRQLNETETVIRLVLAFIDTRDPGERDRLARQAGEVEHQADDARRELMQRLSQTFVTPFDREDLNELSRAIDDIADYAENTIKEIQLYEIEPDQFIRDMVNTLLEAVQELHRAVAALGQSGGASSQAALRAKSLENKMEGLYRKAIASFSPAIDVHYLIKVREVYRHLSNAADRVDLAANVISSIIVKQNL
jgi:predicted phosphate transport protein (TIGR00153 family)